MKFSLLFLLSIFALISARINREGIKNFLVENLKTCGRKVKGETPGEGGGKKKEKGPFVRPWLASLVDAADKKVFCTGAMLTKRKVVFCISIYLTTYWFLLQASGDGGELLLREGQSKEGLPEPVLGKGQGKVR